jgi:ATP-binding cassette subfamily B multidrug efflux pump
MNRQPMGGGPGRPMGGPPGGPPGMHMSHEKAKDINATLLRLWTYLERQRVKLIIVVVLVAINAVLGVLSPYLMGKALDDYIGKGDLAGLARLLFAMITIYLLSSVLTWIQEYLAAYVSQKAVRDMRDDLFTSLQTLSLRFFDQHAHGELMSRLTNDIENVSNVLSSSATSFINSILSLIFVAIMMFVLNTGLAVVSLIILPLVVVATRWLSDRSRQGFRLQQEHLGILNGLIEETITGEHVVQAYGRQAQTISDFDTANKNLQEAATRAQIFGGWGGPVINFVSNLGRTIVVITGGWMAVNQMATVGTIAAFINYAGQFTRPLNMLAQLYNTIQSALAGAERVFETMDETPDLADAPDAKSLDRIRGEVKFEDVCFGYEAGMPVLRHITLCANPGETVALVGPTGAGKTTIINLLTRFYDVDQGAILVDGTDIRLVKKDDLRLKLGIVLQDNFLFADTVMANIRYGRLDASDEEVITAAKLANADLFVHRLPDGYQTMLTERGSNLSQGQRQLVAIARAILANPHILILDEATSNVDTRTEKHVQDALLKLMHGRTNFVIAHRLSTIRNADQVLVINGGEIIERGTHESLLEQGGFYHHLYHSQFKGQMQMLA